LWSKQQTEQLNQELGKQREQTQKKKRRITSPTAAFVSKKSLGEKKPLPEWKGRQAPT